MLRIPLLGHHDAIEQLSSLMKSVKYCQKKAQESGHPTSCRTLLDLIDLQRKVLMPNCSLIITKGGKKITIEAQDIHPEMQKTRALLLDGLVKRFFNRYSPAHSSRGAGKPAGSFLLEKAIMARE